MRSPNVEAADWNRDHHRSGSAFDGLLIRASNLVFATTNSVKLERLIDEKGQSASATVPNFRAACRRIGRSVRAAVGISNETRPDRAAYVRSWLEILTAILRRSP